jgi:hypothetical protein
MSKVKIKIVILGHLPYSIDLNKVRKWKSDLFEIISPISSYNIVGNSDGIYWEFLDENIEKQLPMRDDADILIAVTNVPIQDNFFARRFTDNRICMTYNSMTEILNSENVPLENLLLRVLYSVSFVYKRYGNQIPLMTEMTNFTHDETRGCIFDMNGIKTDVVYSLNRPQLCHSCVETLTSDQTHRVCQELIDKVQYELKRIKKGLYYQISDFVKQRPILAIIISTIIAIILGTIGSIIATFILEKI